MFLSALVAFLTDYLGWTLVFSGTGKLLDKKGTHRAVVEYGLPPDYAGVIGVLLTVLELVTGVGLLLRIFLAVLLPAALVLFCGFFVGVARMLVRRTQMDCHCFGALARERLSTWTMVRLGLLISASVTALVIHFLGTAGRKSTNLGYTWDGTTLSSSLLGFVAVFSSLLLGQAFSLGRIAKFESQYSKVTEPRGGGFYG